jgi:membrane fusion protein (multidrug efflux system)
MPRLPFRNAPALAALLAALAVGGCSQSGEPAPGAGAGAGSSGGNGSAGRGAAAAVPVITVVPKREPFGLEIEAVGTALARESIEVTAKLTNTVTAIRFAEGQNVRRGEVLVELDHAQVAAELAEAQANLAESRSQLARGRDLETTHVLSRAQLDLLETAVKTAEARSAAIRARYDDTFIRAPFDGRTGFRRVSVGGLVNAGAVITTLDDTSTIKLEFTLPQGFLNELTPGLPIEATSEGMAGRVFAGRITVLGSRVDAVTRSIPVRAELPNADGALRPGMFMSLRVKGRVTPTLLLPEEALVPEQGKAYVYVIADGRASRREVQTGGRRPGSVAVLDGLRDGERVVLQGTQRVREGSEVKESAPAAP